jgi:hypothetical protein
MAAEALGGGGDSMSQNILSQLMCFKLSLIICYSRKLQ